MRVYTYSLFLCFIYALLFFGITNLKAKELVLNKGKSISLAYQFHHARKIDTNKKMFVNNSERIRIDNIENNKLSKHKYIFIPFGKLSAGRYTYSIALKPKNKKKSTATYFLLSTNKSKSLSAVITNKKLLTGRLGYLKKIIINDKFKHNNNANFHAECFLPIFGTIRACARLYMNQYQDVNFNMYNELRTNIIITEKNSKDFHGMFIELDQPISKFFFKKGVLIRENGHANILGSQKFPNFIDHIPLNKTKDRTYDSYLGIKHKKKAKVSFDFSFEENSNNFFKFGLSFLSEDNPESSQNIKDIKKFKFSLQIFCKEKKVFEIEQLFKKDKIQLPNNIFYEKEIEIPTCYSNKVSLKYEIDFFGKKGIAYLVDPVVTNKQFNKKQNVILITADALRYDHTSFSGYKRDTTPFINALKKNGVSFSRYFTQKGFTQTSLSVMFSGLYPYRLKTQNAYTKKSMKYYHTDMIKVLFNNGYDIYSVIGSRSFGKFLPGSVFSNRSLFFDSVTDNNRLFRGYQYIKKYNKTNPYFLWIHLRRPHTPYQPEERYRKFSKNSKITSYQTKEKLEMLRDNKKVSKKEIEDIISLYDDNIYTMDQNLAQFFLEAEKNKLLANTLIIFSSDHGESMGEHNQYFQHGVLSSGGINVPLIMVNPERLPKNVEIDSIIESVDLFPSILDILKIKQPYKMDGKSFTKLFKNPKMTHKKFAYADLESKFFTIQNKDYKLIINENEESVEGVNFYFPYTHEKVELYNVKKDPGEKNNIFYENLNIGMNLLEKLIEYKNKFKQTEETTQYSPEMLKLLERTGYLHWKKTKKLKK